MFVCYYNHPYSCLRTSDAGVNENARFNFRSKARSYLNKNIGEWQNEFFMSYLLEQCLLLFLLFSNYRKQTIIRFCYSVIDIIMVKNGILPVWFGPTIEIVETSCATSQATTINILYVSKILFSFFLLALSLSAECYF